jgi:hypothetical protein
MIIKMNKDKQLLITVPSAIYRGETKADLITFLVPTKYGNKNMAECAATLRYLRPDGTGKIEDLTYVPSQYEDYVEFSTTINSQFTQQAGIVTAWITFLDANEAIVLKSGEARIYVADSKDIYDYLDEGDLDQFEKLVTRLDYLDASKADNVDFDDRVLQLTSNGNPIGDAVVIEDVSWGTF